MKFSTVQFFELFEQEVREWVSKLGLLSWQIRVFSSSEDNDKDLQGNRAIIRFKRIARQADIILNSEWEEQPTDALIKRTAFHEVCELLLVRLGCLAFDPKASEGDWDEETHAVIRTLENTLFEALK